MNSFLIKISGFIVFVCVFQTLLNTILPPYWGNEVIYKKFKQLDSSNEQVNTLFIGTSRVHCHIDPTQFDKETRGESKSWNIASPGAAGLETFRIVNDIINTSKTHAIKTIYVEMPSYNAPPVENASNVRATYFLDIPQWSKSIAYMCGRDKGILYIISETIRSTTLLFSNLLGLNHFKTKLDILSDVLFENEIVDTNNNRGFAGLKKTAKDFGPIKTRLQFARKFYSLSVDNKDHEVTFLTKDIKGLIDKASEKGISLVYVLMPKIPLSKYIDNYQSFIQLDSKNRLNFSNPKVYPQLYELKYSSDKAHLNIHGAKVVTSKLADHYKQWLKKNKR